MDHRLLLKFNDDELAHRYDLGNNKVVLDSDNYYYSGGEDSGFDLYVAEDYIFEWGETKLVDYKISCEMLRSTNDGKTYLPTAYYLYPRSSIYKSNLLMVNNVGIIDKEGRSRAAVSEPRRASRIDGAAAGRRWAAVPPGAAERAAGGCAEAGHGSDSD